MVKEKKVKKLDRYKDEKLARKWEREANSLARDFAPGVHSCKDCGHPVLHGYCCTFCGSVNP